LRGLRIGQDYVLVIRPDRRQRKRDERRRPTEVSVRAKLHGNKARPRLDKTGKEALFELTQMARILTSEFGRYAFRDIATSTSPAALEQFKLERLFELRAVIDSLRSQHRPAASQGSGDRDPHSRQ
jgi:hypothetical protein